MPGLVYVLFIVGFVVLIKSADLVVIGASSLAKRFNISDLAIGLTVVAFGTSCPELFVNIVSSYQGETDIAIGNIIGSNICNILLILGISSIIYPLSVSRGTVWREIPLCLLASVLLGIMANDRYWDGADQSVLTRSDGLVFLAFFAIFLYYTWSISGRAEGMEEQPSLKRYGSGKSVLMVLSGLAGLTLGGKWIVDGAVHLAVSFGMSQSLVGLTIVAIGTSLPELATSAMAAKNRNVEIAVGNVVGSNIFNVFFVLGSSSIIKKLPFPQKGNIDIAVSVLASLLLFIWMFTGKKRSLDRWEGGIFLGLYAAYLVFLVIRG